MAENDTRKQSSAIIPNIIHSLDSSHLINIINTGFNINCFPILAIHDCFGCHPNNLINLFELVKLEFIKIYSAESFLTKFHRKNLESMKDYGITIYKDDVKKQDFIILPKGTKMYIPNVPKLGSLEIWDIKNSI